MMLDRAPRRERASESESTAPSRSPSYACCYTVDEGYLLPTLVSAFQLRRELSRDLADVVVVCFGASSAATSAATEFCAEFGLRFLLVPVGILDGNPMVCARFFLPRLLGAAYREILYIDGDTQVAGSLAPLLRYRLAPGYILAAPDPMAVMIAAADRPWPARRAYFRGIGIRDAGQKRYFNSGVMRFHTADWEAVSRECLALCKREGGRFEFRDQDALNIVVGDRCTPMSFKWNFPIFFMNFGAEATIRPRLYHFMSNPRPWHGAFAPWGRTWHAPYAAIAAARPDLARTMRPLRPHTYWRYVVQQRFKRFCESRIWNAPGVRSRVNALEALAAV